MQDSINPRLAHSRRAWLVAVSLVSTVLVAGCGAGSPSETRASADAATTNSRPATTGASHLSALAFAVCMRANGVPNFPDPQPDGNFGFHANAATRSSPAFRAAQAKCQKFMPGGGPLSPGPSASAQTMAQLRKIAVCMRAHGVPQFPDPTPSIPPGLRLGPEYSGVTNYKGAILVFPSSINFHSPAYTQAAAACGPLAENIGLGHPHTDQNGD